MAKAAVRAMDTVEAFLKVGGYINIGANDIDYTADVTRWGVAGASKRGWSTWLTAAVVPDRVVAMVPVVFDLLNFTPNIHHMYENYGGWTWAMQDYVNENIMSFIDSPQMDLWTNITDPIKYADRLTMPKLVVNSGMDEFFMPDDTHWWWNQMPGPKHFLMTPNTDHVCATGVLETIPAIGSFI